jgi:lipopolysaccharide transport system ATP-binding protein
MSDIVISAAKLGKRYRLGGPKPANALRDALTSALDGMFRGPDRRRSRTAEHFWALQDVSFEVRRGDIVGLIGRNGSGKSTLLKILARITRPTEGAAEVRGRLGSLLEVGTGFHGELSGRENIYLSGAILGMKKDEIRRRFDEIVAFAEIERFLDTPVKHYSSGMYVRLGFAVAAHLEPEILLVDEVLAVGDLAFQRKCVGKIHDVAHAGRTVLFVSHDIGAINTLCPSAILLHEGHVIRAGPTAAVVQHYLDGQTKLYSPLRYPVVDRGEIRLRAATVSQHGRATTLIDCRSEFQVVLDYDVHLPLRNSRLVLIFRNHRGEVVFTSSDQDDTVTDHRSPGHFRSTVTVPGKLLKPGPLHGTFNVDIIGDRVLFVAVDVINIDVIDLEPNPLAERSLHDGLVAPILTWALQPRSLRPPTLEPDPTPPRGAS